VIMSASNPPDALTLAVLKGVVEQSLDEILLTFQRLAFSPIITEGRDYGVGIYSRGTGDLLMVDKEAFPLFVWLGQDAVRSVERSQAGMAIERGDIFLVNDPYLTGTHMHDVEVIAPVFLGTDLICFLCVTGHWTDIGGSSPGGFATSATEVYQEGLCIPPVRVMHRGKMNDDVVEFIKRNVRLPETAVGDLFAQISSAVMGVEHVEEIVERFGAEMFLDGLRVLSDTAEQQMRVAIGAIPDGTYHYRDCLDNDGIQLDPVWVDCIATVIGTDLKLDFNGSSPPVQGAFNAPRLTTTAASYIAVLHMFPEVLLTAGATRPIDVDVGPNVFLGAEFPRACEAYGEVSSRIMDVVLGALWQAVPERGQGGIFGTSNNMSISGLDREGRPYIMYAYLGGGQGGTWIHDGLCNGPTAIGVALTPQIETFEHAYPVRFREYALRADSGGVGRFRGGLGVVWEVELLHGPATMSAMADRATRGAAGFMGGTNGAPNVLEIIRADGAAESLEHLTKCERFPLSAGDRIRRLSPGGGGIGNVAERAVEARENDLRLGYISARAYADADVLDSCLT
jgi:N-methylhydantoinase B